MKMRRVRPVLVSSVVVGATTVLAACSGSSSGVAAGGGIESVLSADPSTFNPVLSRAVNDYTLNRLTYDSVLRKGDDGAVVAGLASEWEAISASEYVLTIGEGSTCSDGTAIDADVVANSLKYLADPATKSTWKPLVFGNGDVTIEADKDTQQVKINLSEPFSTLIQTLTLPQTGIICPAGLADAEGLAAGTVEGAFSGPYVVSEAKSGIGYTLELREDYDAWPEFAQALPGKAPSSIYFGISTDASSIVNQLLSGDLHLALLAADDTIDRVKASPDLNVVESSDVSTYLIFNQREGRFFADEANRVAVAQAVDAAAFDTAFSGGRNQVISSVASPVLDCVLEDPALLNSEDSAAAASVLDGKAFKFLSYTAIAAPATDYLYNALTATGADVSLDNPDIATWSSTVNSPDADWDLAVFGDRNTARLVSASLDRFMGPALEDGGRNVGGVVNDEGATALSEGLATTDDAERCAAFKKAQESMLARTDLVPLVANLQYTVTSEDVTIKAYGGSVDHSTLRIVEE